MRKLISFLGAKPPKDGYQPTIYKYNDLEHASMYATAAMTKIFNPDQVYVFVTPEAKSQTLSLFTQDMNDANLGNPIARNIPIGKNATELWQIFNAITDPKVLSTGDTIIFDITNGLRSLPILGFIACAYITSVRKVTIEHLVYGAYDISTPDGKTPVFDLTPFLTLLDWTTATNTFIQTGRAEQLTSLTTPFKNLVVEAFAEQMQTISQELLTTRPVGVIQAASGFNQAFAKVEAAVQEDPAMQPYQQLLKPINEKYSPFAIVDDPITELSAAYEAARQQQRAFLEVQLEMIKWYLEKGLPIQAMTLAREWLVSLGVYHQKEKELNLFSHYDRDGISKLLNEKANPNKQIPSNKSDKKNKRSDRKKLVPSPSLSLHLEQIVDVWAGFGIEGDDSAEAANRVRNDIAHCGMDMNNGRPAKDIVKQANIICQRLYTLLPTE